MYGQSTTRAQHEADGASSGRAVFVTLAENADRCVISSIPVEIGHTQSIAEVVKTLGGFQEIAGDAALLKRKLLAYPQVIGQPKSARCAVEDID